MGGLQEAHGDHIWDNAVLNMGPANGWPLWPQHPQPVSLHPAAQNQLMVDPDDRSEDVNSSSSSSNSLVRRRNQNRLPYRQAGEFSLWGAFPLSLNLQSSKMPAWVSLFVSEGLRKLLSQAMPHLQSSAWWTNASLSHHFLGSQNNIAGCSSVQIQAVEEDS
jgi:hypothetical protein